MDLMKLRRKILFGLDNVACKILYVSAANITDISNLKTSNSYGTTIDSTSYDGEIIVTQASTSKPNQPKAYENGFFAISFDRQLPQNKYYRITADITITNSLLGSDLIDIAPFGRAADATETRIVNGKINQVFLYTENASRNYISLRICGNSLIVRNLKIYAL